MKIQKVNINDPNFKENFIQSLKETGFAVISGTSVDQSTVEKVQKNWRSKFFLQDKNVKLQYLYNKDDHSGFFPYKSENAKDEEVPDLKEFFHIFKEDHLPKEIEKDETWELREKIHKMGLQLLSYIEEDLGVEKDLFQNTVKNCDRTLFRILYYPALQGEEQGVRAAAHEDINLITLLPAQSSSGLEAKDSEGNWHSVNYEAGDIVVNVGDMLQMYTDGAYKSTTHRVSNPNNLNTDRMSMPLFMHPEPDFDLKKMTAGEYLDQRLKEILKEKK